MNCGPSSCTNPITFPTLVVNSPVCLNDACNTGNDPGPNFTGNNCQDFPNATAWFEVTTGNTTASLDISVISADLNDPYFAVFETNDCFNYITHGCVTGGGGMVDDEVLVPVNTTLLIAVSDLNGLVGDFDLCVTALEDQSACNTDNELVVTNTSMGSPVTGPYLPGEVVSYCYTINQYEQLNCAWLHGIIPEFGDCWDPASFNAQGEPVNITTPLTQQGSLNSGGADWDWWADGAVQNNQSGDDVGAGWFFSNPTGSDPNNSWGDGNGMGMNGDCDGANSGLSWTICFDLTVRTDCENGTACNVSFETTSDGETGSFVNLACTADSPTFLNNTVLCCQLTVDAGIDEVLCSTGSTSLNGSFANEDGATTVEWTSSPAGALAGLSDPNILNPTFTPPTGMTGPVTFTLTVEDDQCAISDNVVITILAEPELDLVGDIFECDSYTLPPISGTNLTGSEAYYTNIDGTGTQYLPGSTINYGDFPSYPVTIYIYDAASTSPPCFDQTTFELTLGETPIVTMPDPAGICIDAGIQSGLGGGSPAGGVYSGDGVTDDGNGSTFTFDPVAAGIGTTTITYTVVTLPDPPACSDFTTAEIEVYALPALTFTALADLCIDAGVQGGSGATPIGGVYSGSGVTDDGNGSTYSFDPIAASVGTHTLTYTYTDGNGCTNSITDDVEVFELPTLTFTAPADLCIDAGVQAGLGGATPTGGVYSGPGVTDDGNGTSYSFDPMAAGAGIHTITYTYTDGNGCTNSITDDVEVYALPVLTFPALADVCLNAGVQSGLGNATPTGGAYSGNGVTDDGNGTTFTFDPITAGVGIHTVTYTFTDGNSCTNVISEDIEVFDAPTIGGTLEACEGTQSNLTGSGTPNSTDPWLSSDAGIATVDVNGMVTGVAPGSVTITYTDENGCIAQENFTVHPNPVITLTPNDPSICNGNDGFITVNGAGTGTVNWTGAAVGSDSPVALPYDITGLEAGNYNVTYTDGTTGCPSSSVSTSLNNPGAPIIDPIADTMSCEVDFVIPDPATYITGTNLTGDQAFYSATGGNAVDELVQGTIITSAMSPMTVFAYDNNGTCEAQISFIVTVNENPTASISPDPAIACEGTVINLNGNPAGGSGTYSVHEWTGDVMILNSTNVVNPNTLAGATPNTYNLTYNVTDNNGCMGTDNITVQINEVPVLSGVTEVCVGLSTTINSTGTPDATTPWSTSDAGIATVDVNGVVTGVAGGVVDITFLDANGCDETITVTVNENPIISLTPSDPTTCNGTNGFITVNGTGNGIVNWSGDASGSDSPVALPYDITNLTAGNYDVEFTDGTTGCISNNANTSLNNPSEPIIDPIQDTISCAVEYVIPDANTSITGTNLTGNQAYYSAPGGNIGDLLATGNVITAAMSPMTIYAYDVNGTCESEESFLVIINENPTTSITPDPALVCAGIDLQLNGNPSGGSGVYTSHEWTNVGASSLDDANTVDPIFNNTTSSSYDLTYTVTDDNGCFGTGNITVIVDPNPDPVISPSPAEVCSGIDLQMNGNPTGGTGTYISHAWTNTGATSLDDANIVDPIFNNTTAGSYDLTYTVTDDNGCFGSDNIVVVVQENPSAVISPDPAEACAGIDLNLNGNPVDGSGTYINHEWTNTGATSLNSTTIVDPIFNNTISDTYDLTYTVTDDNGCIGVNNITVTVNENPTVDLTPASVCSGEDLQLNGNPVDGSGTYINHDWTNTGASSLNDATIENPIFNNTTAGNYDLTYTVTDDNGCIATDDLVITVIANPVIDPLGPIEACDSYELPMITGTDLSGNEAYYDDTQANGGNSITGPINTSTTVYMYDGASGCSSEEQVEITINPLPEVISISGDGEYCEYDTIQNVLIEVNGTPDWSLEFTIDGSSEVINSSNSTIDLGNDPGLYELTLLEDNNCSSTISGTIEVVIKPTPDAPSVSDDETYCSSADFDNMSASGNGESFTWYEDDTYISVIGVGSELTPSNVTGITSYYVSQTIDGCEGPLSEVIITVNECEITIPTAITPDNDGNNDTWEVLLLDEAYPNNHVQIYNRWGNLLFEHNSKENGPYNENRWDGTYNGKPLPVGSYYYVIDFNNQEGESATGSISIILD